MKLQIGERGGPSNQPHEQLAAAFYGDERERERKHWLIVKRKRERERERERETEKPVLIRTL
jgi:hypothetical protein